MGRYLKGSLKFSWERRGYRSPPPLTPNARVVAGLLACCFCLLFDTFFWPCAVILGLAALAALAHVTVWVLGRF